MEKENLKSSQDQLKQIHEMMERSSRFISLSGLSGIFAGLIALAGSAFAFKIIKSAASVSNPSMIQLNMHTLSRQTVEQLILLGLAMVALALTAGVLMTVKKARKKNQAVWGKMSQRLLINLMIPLVSGGIFCLILIKHDLFGLVAPVTLLFYGLALVNASKYTLDDIRYLGYFEILLGLISSLFIGYGLAFWAAGFGVLHIIYGTLMYFKYDQA